MAAPCRARRSDLPDDGRRHRPLRHGGSHASRLGSERRAAACQATAGDGPSAGVLIDLVCVIGGIFALIALMPPFDGTNGGDWGDHEPDDG